MTTNKISNVNGTTNAPATGTPRKVKTEAKVNVREGMRTADVKANGSAAQKLVADAFDGSFGVEIGTYNKRNAEAMNDYTFALDGNELRAYNRRTGCNVKIIANNQAELKNYAGFIRQSENLEGGNIIYDVKTQTALYNDISGAQVHLLNSNLETVNFVNCDLDYINATMFDGKLNIKDTKEVGTLWDSATRISVNADPNKKPTLNIDSASKVEIQEYE